MNATANYTQAFCWTLAVVVIKYLVANANLAARDLLIALLVLRHLGFVTKILLEERRDLPDGTNSSTVQLTNHGGNTGRVSRLMVARLNVVSIDSIVANV